MMKKIAVLAMLMLQWGWSQKTGTAQTDVTDIKKPKAKETRCLVRGIPISQQQDLPFKLYHFNSETEQWQTRQDVYNTLNAGNPAIQVSVRSQFDFNPRLRGRGGSTPIVIVDGIRYDASILDFLNPNDIECITVANGMAATNYFRNN